MLHRITTDIEQGRQPQSSDSPCTDILVQRANTGEYQPNPFPSTDHYALTITNLDLEDAAGHALSLIEDGTPGSWMGSVSRTWRPMHLIHAPVPPDVARQRVLALPS